MGFSYFHGIWILSGINSLVPCKINKYYNLLHSACLFICYFIYSAPGACVNDILLYELCIWTRFFSFLLSRSMVRSLHWWSFSQTHHAQRLLRFALDGWPQIMNILCILIIIESSRQSKDGRERFTPNHYQSKDPSRFELFCFISKCL